MLKPIWLLLYSNICYYSYHCVLDLKQVSTAPAMEYYKMYQGLKVVESQENDNETDITIPN